MVDGKPEIHVQLYGRGVGRVDVQHRLADALCGQVVEASQSELAAEAAPGELRVYCHHVDLAQRRVVPRVDLGPAEAGQPAVQLLGLVQQKAVGVEPGLDFSRLDRLFGPTPLLWVPVEGAVVDFEPRLFVGSGLERARLYRRVLLQR